MPENLHQQPGAVAAGAAQQRQRLLRRLNARLHADQIFDLLLKLLVQLDQIIDGPNASACESACDILRQLWRRRARLPDRESIPGEDGVVFKRKFLGIFLQEEIERIDDRHLGDQIDFDRKIRVVFFGKTSRASRLL